MLTERPTLTQFLVAQHRDHPDSGDGLQLLVLQVALACKAISKHLASGPLTDLIGKAEAGDAQEENQKLDLMANDRFLRVNEWGGQLAGMVSGELDEPYPIPAEYPRGHYLLSFDPLDGSSSINVNGSGGSIFSILRAPIAGGAATAADFMQPGTEQVAAGYAIYGPATVLVLTVGTGVHAFALDPHLGEFFLTRQGIQIPEATAEYAVNSSNRRFWGAAVARYIDECLQGVPGPRGMDFNVRWGASLVAEAHRILTRGGVFVCSRDSEDPIREGPLHLLYEANPIAFMIEQAGGLATTGRERILDVEPIDIHQRIGFIFGSREEVERLVRYHRDEAVETSEVRPQWNPLYGQRGLFNAV